MAATLTSPSKVAETKDAPAAPAATAPTKSSRSATLRAAAALSAAAALVHLWVAPQHLQEWWGYGALFLATAAAQMIFAAGLLRSPGQPFLLAGVAGNLSIVVGYVVTRTVGVPFVGPHAWHPEGVGPLDVAATASEMALVVVVITLLVGRYRAAVGHALLSAGVAFALSAGAWGTFASIGAEPPAAKIGGWVDASGGLLRVDRVAPESMAAMQMGKFAEQGMSMGSATGMDMAPDGQRRFAVDVTLAAPEDGELAYSTDEFRLTGAGLEGTGPHRDTLSEGSIPAGSRVSGTLVFQAPEDADGLELRLGEGGDPVALPLEPISGNGGGEDGGAEGGAGGGHQH